MLGPGSIVTNHTYDYNKLCGTGLQYGEPHERSNNTIKYHISGAITVLTTGDPQGVLYFIILYTACYMHRMKDTPLHMSDGAIEKVYGIATK